jgi:transposase
MQQESKRNYVGIDLGKRKLDAIRIDQNGSVERRIFSTDMKGRNMLLKWLKPNDIVGMETGNLAFFLADMMQKNKIEVYVLNAGQIQLIYNSLKKTDKEDALKLARLVQRIPVEELPVVRIPDEYEKKARALLTNQEYWVTSRTRAYNYLHSILCNNGITTVTKKELKDEDFRKAIINSLDKDYRRLAERVLEEINLSNRILAEIEDEIVDMLKEKKEETKIVMSVCGIGKITALAILGYIGTDCNRFKHVKQVAYYAGLVPRVDQSGTLDKRLGIIKGGSHHLKRLIVQGAWSIVRSKNGGVLKAKYEELIKRKPKGKAIIAIARKMIELVYTLLRKREYCNYMPILELNKKLAVNKII